MAGEYRINQIGAEVVASTTAPVRVHALNVEVVTSEVAPVRVHAMFVEVVRSIEEYTAPAVPNRRISFIP